MIEIPNLTKTKVGWGAQLLFICFCQNIEVFACIQVQIW